VFAVAEVCKHRELSENQSGEIIGAKNVSSELKIKSTPAALGNRERVSFQPASADFGADGGDYLFANTQTPRARRG